MKKATFELDFTPRSTGKRPIGIELHSTGKRPIGRVRIEFTSASFDFAIRGPGKSTQSAFRTALHLPGYSLVHTCSSQVAGLRGWRLPDYNRVARRCGMCHSTPALRRSQDCEFGGCQVIAVLLAGVECTIPHLLFAGRRTARLGAAKLNCIPGAGVRRSVSPRPGASRGPLPLSRTASADSLLEQIERVLSAGEHHCESALGTQFGFAVRSPWFSPGAKSFRK